ncbi:MBL fold metallo-hydrolase [Skermanella rosea]|uniref:MBL fold metallo-hydrolase n=1 Tax=Skermanella rosea TaxID=1817965 RepID=UPI0019334BE9|nr:MBL fold metallo-hydrolase [Skermanella rosea]UEM02474.1 MBL fold metallo-hydrolase [Skermanella rosea]
MDWTGKGCRAGASRRDFNRLAIRTLLAAGAAVTLGPRRAMAGGDGTVRTVSDGHLQLPLDFVLPGIPQAELADFRREFGLPQDGLRPECNVTLLRLPGRLVLFDAGAGPNFMPTAGKLPDNLAKAGIDPAEITDVVFTHAHPDHIWGVTDDFDEIVFPNATFRISRTEWDYWRAEETLASMPDERKAFVVGARGRLDAIEPRMALFDAGEEVLPRVEAFDAAGHTPGHMAFVVHGLDDPIMVVGDAVSNDPISFARPDWPWGADHDPARGAATRRRLLDRLAGDRARLVGFHLPGGGIGRAERQGGGYRFVREG